MFATVAGVAGPAHATLLVYEPFDYAGGTVLDGTPASALFTLDDSTNGNRRAAITLRDDDSGGTLSFGEPVIGGRAIFVGAETSALGGFVSAGADQSFEDGQTLLLVGRYRNAASPGGDRLELIGYDTADADLLITSITFTIRGDDNNFLDELRIGDSYASVLVPEPAPVSLLLLGLLTSARTPRRRAGRRRRSAPCAPRAGAPSARAARRRRG